MHPHLYVVVYAFALTATSWTFISIMHLSTSWTIWWCSLHSVSSPLSGPLVHCIVHSHTESRVLVSCVSVESKESKTTSYANAVGDGNYTCYEHSVNGT